MMGAALAILALVCYNPKSAVEFTVSPAISYTLDGETLVVKTPTVPVIYRLPEGTACAMKENNNNEQDQQAGSFRSDPDPSTGRNGWRRPSVLELQPPKP